MSWDVPATNRLTSGIIGAAVRVHRAFGPGLLENAYLACLCYELTAAGMRYELQKAIPLVYNGVKVDCAYRVDLVVGDSVLVEVKALETITPIQFRQLHTYLRLGQFPIGLLLNFGAATMKEGIKRVVNGFPVHLGSLGDTVTSEEISP
jgi:GxxExxY protein